MSNSVPDTPEATFGNRKRSQSEKLYDRITDWKNWLLIVAIGSWLAGRAGIIDLPTVTDFHKILILGILGGYIGAKVLVWPTVKSRIDSQKVKVAITPAEGVILDFIKVPYETFWSYNLIGGLRQKVGLDGDVVFAARGVDLERGIVVAAGDRPEDTEVPDDVQLIGSGADELYNKLRGEVLDEYRAGTNRTRDKEAMLEEAKRQATNEFAEVFQSIRAGDIDIQDLSRSEAEERADDLIRSLAASVAGGDNDE